MHNKYDNTEGDALLVPHASSTIWAEPHAAHVHCKGVGLGDL